MSEETNKQEKTEDATPRRQEESREKGQVAMSTELLSATSLVVGFGALLLAGGVVAQATASMVVETVLNLGSGVLGNLTPEGVASVLGKAGKTAAVATAPLILPLFLIVTLTGYAQAGIRITPQAIQWDPKKLNPASNVSKLFSTRTVVRTSGAFLKIIVIATSMSLVAWREIPHVAALSGADLGPLLKGMMSVAIRCAIAALIAIVALAVIDYLYQRFQHEKDMKMTKKELKDEMKNSEGDPQLKSRIRRVQRELARSRMMDEVPKATVVITNPTHYAVALRYDRETDQSMGRAPRVVAKGVDHLAQRIKEIAREANVLCYEDVPLARALHAQVEIGDEVPEAIYQAVAGVLAYVYRVQGGKSAA
jgi:flagellar biosynthetic protein FlhB